MPTHWRMEVANGALIGERRRRVDIGQTATLVDLLAKIETETDQQGSDSVMTTVLPLARATRLTVYDAMYLELAERRGLPLATFDADLAKTARKAGVEVLP